MSTGLITCTEWKALQTERRDQNWRWLHGKKELLDKKKEWVYTVRDRCCDASSGDETCCQLITEFVLANDNDTDFENALTAIGNHDFLSWSVSCGNSCWQQAGLEAEMYYHDEVKKYLDKYQAHIDLWMEFIELLLLNGCALKNVPARIIKVPPIYSPLPPG